MPPRSPSHQAAYAALGRGDAKAALEAAGDDAPPHLVAEAYWLAGAVERLATAIDAWDHPDGAGEATPLSFYRAWVAARRGHVEAARDLLDRIDDGAPAQIRDRAAIVRAQLAGPVAGDAQLARLPAALRGDASPAIDLARAQLAVARGDVRAARRHLADVPPHDLDAAIVHARLTALLEPPSDAAYEALDGPTETAGRRGLAATLARVHLARADLCRRPDFRVVHVEHAVTLMDALGDRRGAALAGAFECLVELELGELDEAELAARAAVDAADATGCLLAAAQARVVLGVTHQRQGRPEDARRHLETAAAIAGAHGILPWRLHALAALDRRAEASAMARAAGLPEDRWGIA